MQETMMTVPFGTVTVAVEHYKALVETVANEKNLINNIKALVADEIAYKSKHGYTVTDLAATLATMLEISDSNGNGYQE